MSSDSCVRSSFSERVFSWVRSQLQREDIQSMWCNDIVRPCLQSVMNILVREYMQYALMMCVAWSILLALLVVVLTTFVRQWTTVAV